MDYCVYQHLTAAKMSKLSKYEKCCGMVSRVNGDWKRQTGLFCHGVLKWKYVSSEKYFWYRLFESALGPRSSCLFFLTCAFVGPDFPVKSTDSMKPLKIMQ